MSSLGLAISAPPGQEILWYSAVEPYGSIGRAAIMPSAWITDHPRGLRQEGGGEEGDQETTNSGLWQIPAHRSSHRHWFLK
jgi:hypothetical protein